ncbi:hypothetical protein ES703_13532 [subsurface metagenome]
MKKIFNILVIITLFLSMNLSVSSCAIAPEVITEETEVITTEEEIAEETTEETTEEITEEKPVKKMSEEELIEAVELAFAEYKEAVREVIVDSFGGTLTKFVHDRDSDTFYLAYNSMWASEDTIKKEVFDIVSFFALGRCETNLDVVATNDFGTSYHSYTKIDILFKIKNYEISYEEWVDEAFLK